MLNVSALKPEDIKELSKGAVAELAAAMLSRLAAQAEQLDDAARRIAERDRAIWFKDAKIERITFELARLKAWRYGARTPRVRLVVASAIFAEAQPHEPKPTFHRVPRASAEQSQAELAPKKRTPRGLLF